MDNNELFSNWMDQVPDVVDDGSNVEIVDVKKVDVSEIYDKDGVLISGSDDKSVLGDGHKRINGAPVSTSMAVVSMIQDITETSTFQQTLNSIPEKLDKVDLLLKEWRKDPDAFVENVNEADLDNDLAELNSISKFSTSISNDRKSIKKYFDTQRDLAMDYLDERLENARFNELVTAKADITTLKADITAHRANTRWAELKATFDASIAQYNIIARLAPELQDYSRFRLINPKLVSGAKTRKITDKVRQSVSDIVFEWGTALEAIEANQWGLDSADQFKLLNGFKANPSMSYVTKEGSALKTAMQRRIEAEKRAEELREKQEAENKARKAEQEAEMERIRKQQAEAKLKHDAEAKIQADKEAQALKERMAQAEALEKSRRAEIEKLSTLYVKPQVKQEFPEFVDYVFGNKSYHDVHSNSRTKARLAYDAMMQTGKPNSVVMRETAGDPDKVLDLLRFILDV